MMNKLSVGWEWWWCGADHPAQPRGGKSIERTHRVGMKTLHCTCFAVKCTNFCAKVIWCSRKKKEKKKEVEREAMDGAGVNGYQIIAISARYSCRRWTRGISHHSLNVRKEIDGV